MSTIQRATKRFGFRYAYALAAAALLVTMLVSGAMAQSIIHAVDGAHGQQYVDHVSEMARKFSTETGIQVNVMTASGHREQIAVWAAGGALPDAIDIVSDNGLGFFRQGLFMDLTQFFDRGSQRLDDLIPIAVEAFTAPENLEVQPGAVFAFPSFLHNYNAGYNVPIFENAGLVFPSELGEAWNWETLRDYARKLTIDRNSDGRIDQWGLFIPKSYLGWGPLFRHAGNPIFDRDVDPTAAFLNTEAAIETVEFLAEMTEGQYFVWENWQFSEGRTGLSYAFASNTAQLMADRHLTVDYAPYAYGPGGVNGSEFQVAATAISSTTEHADLVWQWLTFLWGDPSNTEGMINATKRIPAQISGLTLFNDLASDWAPNIHVVAASAGLPGSGLRPIVRDSRILGTISNWVHQAIDGQVPAFSALTTAQEQVDAIFRELAAN